MTRIFYFLALFTILISLHSCEKSNYIPADRTTLHQDRDDEKILHITKLARDTLPDFFRHMLRPAKDESNFMVKYPFKADADSGFSMEQLWLRNIQFKDGVYYGVVANMPFYIESIKKGDTISFSMEDISDWMYTSGKKIVGGYSIKYLLEQIPEHSKEQKLILEMLPD